MCLLCCALCDDRDRDARAAALCGPGRALPVANHACELVFFVFFSPRLVPEIRRGPPGPMQPILSVPPIHCFPVLDDNFFLSNFRTDCRFMTLWV